MFEIHLSHLKYITGICQEYITSFPILCHILIFAFLESFQFCRVITFYPTSLIKTHRLPSARRVVLIQQTILDNLKLQLPHRTDNFTTVELIDKQLSHTFVHQLINSFSQLLLLHRIGILNILEHFRRETRQAAEMKHFTFRQRIANLESTIIRQTDNISGVCLVNRCLTLCHKLGRR